MKHRMVVARPTEACIVWELHVPNSTNIMTKAAIVIDQVSTMKNLCHYERKKLIVFHQSERRARKATIKSLSFCTIGGLMMCALSAEKLSVSSDISLTVR